MTFNHLDRFTFIRDYYCLFWSHLAKTFQEENVPMIERIWYIMNPLNHLEVIRRAKKRFNEVRGIN